MNDDVGHFAAGEERLIKPQYIFERGDTVVVEAGLSSSHPA